MTAANHFKGKTSCYEQTLSGLTDKAESSSALNNQAFKNSFLLKLVMCMILFLTSKEACWEEAYCGRGRVLIT